MLQSIMSSETRKKAWRSSVSQPRVAAWKYSSSVRGRPRSTEAESTTDMPRLHLPPTTLNSRDCRGTQETGGQQVVGRWPCAGSAIYLGNQGPSDTGSRNIKNNINTPSCTSHRLVEGGCRSGPARGGPPGVWGRRPRTPEALSFGPCLRCGVSVVRDETREGFEMVQIQVNRTKCGLGGNPFCTDSLGGTRRGDNLEGVEQREQREPDNGTRT
ncbi:hypothetical protein VTJ49DRAFT_4748 [Mycothermus thermophilus]|uniref:Uncharacterized protein n=1 Tax=Humicola insolens TaxID=85995 RepID=A0ABR3V5V4_HUMIN